MIIEGQMQGIEDIRKPFSHDAKHVFNGHEAWRKARRIVIIA
jgi:hypothetical protein